MMIDTIMKLVLNIGNCLVAIKIVRLHMLTGGYYPVLPTSKDELAGEAFFMGVRNANIRRFYRSKSNYYIIFRA